MTSRYEKVHIIINPAAGQDEPILNTLNDVFRQYKIDWDASITHGAGDATRFTQQAVAAGVDLVAGYGGDGTQMEIANGVIGSDVPMAILPGGTGNAMAFDLHVPRDLRQAAELICQSPNQRNVDLGRVGKRYFMLRVYTGPKEEQLASREMKDQYGLLAYPMATIRVMREMGDIPYKLTIDGKEIEDQGFICIIFNAGSPGGVTLPENPHVASDDGLLDVFMLSRSITSLGAFTSYRLGRDFGNTNVHHWRGQEITIEADPTQPAWIDGEPHGNTPFTATVIPAAIRVVVP
jgi:YegS/Rv2252/BmrU family lipid kinase